MAIDNQNTERKVSVSINIRASSMSQSQALELENKLRDICDDYQGVDVSAQYGNERPSLRP